MRNYALTIEGRFHATVGVDAESEDEAREKWDNGEVDCAILDVNELMDFELTEIEAL